MTLRYFVVKKNFKKKLNKFQFLIEKFCKTPEKIWASTKERKAQIALAKKLYELESETFWRKADLPFELNSLAWFLTEDGKNYTKLEKKRQTLTPKKQPEENKLRKNKIGKDMKINKKPKNILQFLRSKHG